MRALRPALPAAFFALILFAASGAARAAESHAAKAREHYQRGEAYFKLEKYKEALAEFEEGFIVKPDTAYLYEIAQCHRLMGNNPTALRFYKRYLEEGGKGPNRAQAEQRIHELEGPAPRPATAVAAKPAPAPAPRPAAAPAPKPAAPPPAQAQAAKAPAPAPAASTQPKPAPAPVATQPPPARTQPPPPAAPPPAAAPAPAPQPVVATAPPPAAVPPPASDAPPPGVMVQTTAPPPAGANQAQPRRHSRWWLWALIGVAAVGVVAGTATVIAVGSSGKSDPTCPAGRVCQ